MPLPTGTITFLFSDIEGSTARWETHRDAMQSALRRHDELMRVIFERHAGHVFKTVGDEFCVAFSRAEDAARAAIEAQRAILAGEWSAVGGLRVRMALHTGVADERDGDYFGPAVNRVARILAAGHGEQIVVSDATAHLLAPVLRDDVRLRDLGAHRLKDLPQAQTLHQLVARGLRGDFPPLRSVDASPTNVPLQLTPFLGRERELAEIEALLREARLITLTGSGGIGKTRIAQRIAADRLTEYPDGAWFVDLAPLVSGDLVPATVAAALGIHAGGDAALHELVATLKNRRLLIVLDNCEHVIAPAAAMTEAMLRQCPGVRVLATSREALGVAGERAFRMPSLPEETAIALFADRARAVQSRFELTEENEPVVREIVRRLDGIALAIELAASRVKVLSVERIATGLNERFKLLARGSRTALPRQQTLKALIDWSYELLSQAERSMLQQLSVFRGGWNLDAAIEVCVDPRFDDWDALELLESLVEKSLIVVDAADADTRYRMLESTREYARERIEEAGDADAAEHRHFDCFLNASEQFYDRFWRANLDEWNAQMRPELENFRTAIDWSIARGGDAANGARLVANLCHSRVYELRELLNARYEAIARAASPHTRGRLAMGYARLLTDTEANLDVAREAVRLLEPISEAEYVEASLYLGGALYKSGDVGAAVKTAQETCRRARALGIPRLLANVLTNAGLWSTVEGDSSGRAAIEEAAAILRALGDKSRLKMPLGDLAEALFAVGDAEGAYRCAVEALAIDRGEGNAHLMMLRNVNAAAYLLALDRHHAARPFVEDALDAGSVREERVLSAIAVGHAGEIAVNDGDAETAARLLGYTDGVYAASRLVREPTERAARERVLAALREALPEHVIVTLMSEGARMPEAAAIATARIKLDQIVTKTRAAAL